MLDRLPVIIGIGEITDRPNAVSAAIEPMDLMAEALRRADEDGGGGWLAKLSSLDVINISSWAYEDLPAQLSEKLSISPARLRYRPTGGETPTRAIHKAARAIYSGEQTVCAVAGGEALHATRMAAKAGEALPWTPRAKGGAPDYAEVFALLNPQAAQMGLFLPSSVYPLYENACAAAWGQSPQEAHEQSAKIWAQYSAASARNPYSWQQEPQSADAIAAPSPANRMIAYPYTKAMVANGFVNQGAAAILTSYGLAKAAGVDEESIIFVNGGAAATAPRDFIARARYDDSPAMRAVLDHAQKTFGDIDAAELYSCFPIVPKMAQQVIGKSMPPTVTGGLSFFGAPLNNYMTHAACAMVRALRGGAQSGLLYGQGEYVTKHHTLHVSRAPKTALGGDIDLSDGHGFSGREVPAYAANISGPARLETFTVIYDRSGAPKSGVIIAKAEGQHAQTRSLARADDPASFDRLLDPKTSPIGASGHLREGPDGLCIWQFA